MENSKFYRNLTSYTNAHDEENANRVIMTELAKILTKDKSDFIEVLKNANVLVSDNASDVTLINAFVENAPSNRNLLLGAAFLINHKNQTIGFDGEEELSDAGVKAVYKVMYNYFDAAQHEDTSEVVVDDFYSADGADEEFSYAGWSDAVKSIADLGTTVGGGIMQSQRQKKFGVSDTLAKQTEARKQLAQTVLAQRQEQAAAKAKEKEAKSKTVKTALIIGGAVLGLAIIGLVIYKIKKKK